MKQALYLSVVVVLVGSMVIFISQCSAGARRQEKASTQLSSPAVNGQQPPSNKSSNGASMVRFVPEPANAPPPFPYIVGCAVDEQHAWVTDVNVGDLLRTTDGGRTWQRMRLSGEAPFGRPRDIYYFVTPMRGWLVASSGTWQTADTGLTWQLVFPQRANGLNFADAQHGWMSLSVTDLSEQSYVTQDGGQTWQPCGPKRAYNQQTPSRYTYFLTPQLGWAITSNTNEERQTIMGVARSTDGGCNWQQLWVNNKKSDDRYIDIYFLNEREGWLVPSESPYLYHTEDGGRTWKDVPLPSEKWAAHVYFTTTEDGWLILANPSPTEVGLYRTTNGGETWRSLASSEITSSNIPATWKAGRLFQMLYAAKKYDQ